MKAVLIKTSYTGTFKRLPDERVEIEADDAEELFGLFFRDYNNRYKYCSTLSYRFEDENVATAYREWISDVRNYAANGGDMW